MYCDDAKNVCKRFSRLIVIYFVLILTVSVHLEILRKKECIFVLPKIVRLCCSFINYLIEESELGEKKNVFRIYKNCISLYSITVTPIYHLGYQCCIYTYIFCTYIF